MVEDKSRSLLAVGGPMHGVQRKHPLAMYLSLYLKVGRWADQSVIIIPLYASLLSFFSVHLCRVALPLSVS